MVATVISMGRSELHVRISVLPSGTPNRFKKTGNVGRVIYRDVALKGIGEIIGFGNLNPDALYVWSHP